MQLTIFLVIEELDCLEQFVVRASSTAIALERAKRSRECWGSFGRNVIVECNEGDSSDLLLCARCHCPSAVEKIGAGLRLALIRCGSEFA